MKKVRDKMNEEYKKQIELFTKVYREDGLILIGSQYYNAKKYDEGIMERVPYPSAKVMGEIAKICGVEDE